ncbi:hypothetical protein SEUBUCD646_0L03230 [Saccharomyces eubayanus]|uniref:G-patch domain-containing protein n=2 Tax=Saccharomyces TaxID=4930 RepID=A0A6C1EDM6_SACPS|nr:hypothetical protein DI49_3780 [Saccharomyces eubayanus]KOG97959.1 hypothetical protein DI49_3780 [Saccharomyces eubayanus]QID86837.1 hypothetical protein GRS66_009482 [Saccharomyces pastorianus]CAI1592503.1 hypothetical protein SEUBUCD650_0L03220 [Saccharomyces eubayanus]CAI1618180.1 hypothetical protein SEUBUCD646_0L03230 [Saccharomyces eubayanus]
MREDRQKRNREDSADEKNIPPRKRSKTGSTDDETASTKLRSAVPKGYKMMEKMGYKEGETLGKNTNALKEPIKVKIHSKKQGIRTSKPTTRTANDIQTSEQAFKERESKKKKNKQLEKVWYNMQKTAFEMTGDSELYNPGEDPRDFNVLWRSYVILLNDKLRENLSNSDSTKAKDKVKLVSEEELESSLADKTKAIKDAPVVIEYDTTVIDDDIIEDGELAALRELSIEKRITKLNVLLRSEKYYCFFCGVRYKDEGDLYEHCPGTNEEDHE